MTNSRIKSERALANVSQLELATVLEVAPLTLSKWEKDIDRCPTGYVKKMAEYFQCSVDYLIGISESRR